MKIFGRRDKRVSSAPDFAPHALLTRGAYLQVGDARHVVIGHRGGEIFRGRDRERKACASPPAARSRLEMPTRSRYSRGIGRVEIIDELACARRQHRLRLRLETRECARQIGRVRHCRCSAGHGAKRFSGTAHRLDRDRFVAGRRLRRRRAGSPRRPCRRRGSPPRKPRAGTAAPRPPRARRT